MLEGKKSVFVPFDSEPEQALTVALSFTEYLLVDPVKLASPNNLTLNSQVSKRFGYCALLSGCVIVDIVVKLPVSLSSVPC